MKKEWNRPRALVQHFIANEYIASSCGTTQTKYVFDCNVPLGDIYLESNGEPGLQTSPKRGRKPDTLIGRNLYGCGYNHEAPTKDDFPHGYDVTNRGVENILLWYDKSEGDQAGGGWHGTINTLQEEWEVVKS